MTVIFIISLNINIMLKTIATYYILLFPPLTSLKNNLKKPQKQAFDKHFLCAKYIFSLSTILR